MALPVRETVKLADLNIVVDPSTKMPEMDLSKARYQHPPQLTKVKGIANSWDETAVGCPLISRRKDGSLFVIDGQNRILAMWLLGITEWSCEVYDGLTERQEAGVYRKLNGRRRRPPAYDVNWNAALIERDPIVVGAEKVMTSYGLTVGQRTTTSQCGSPNAIIDLYRREMKGKPGGLTEVLDVGKHHSFPDGFLEAPMLLGYGLFINRHSAHAGRLLTDVAPGVVHRLARGRVDRNTMLNERHVLAQLREALGL